MELTNLIQKSGSLRKLQQACGSQNTWLVEGLKSAPKALLAALLAESTKKSVILITGGVREDRLFDDIAFFNPQLPVEFPAWETLPGEEIPPSPDILGKRFEALHTLLSKKGPFVVLCPIQALLQKTVLPKDLRPLLQMFEKKKEIAFDTLPQMLLDLGYKRESIVADKGQFAVRGGIVDLFPLSSPDPYRIEFFGDCIEEIRSFDPIGQKSVGKVDRFFLCPANELALLQKADQLGSLIDYLDDPFLFWDDLAAIEDTYVGLKQMPGARSHLFSSFKDLLQKCPKHLFHTAQKIEELSSVVAYCPHSNRENFCGHHNGPSFEDHQNSHNLSANSIEKEKIAFEAFNHVFTATRFEHPFQNIEQVAAIPPHFTSFFINANETEELEVKKAIEPLSMNPRFERGVLSKGFIIQDASIALIANSDISKRSHIRRQKWRSTHHTPASEFHALSVGDLVVHFHSGIGKYKGMEKQKNHLGQETEFLVLEYAEQSKLFVPLSQAHLVSRYIGAKEETPSLSQLGTKRWQKIRDQAQTQIVGYANDLLQRQAERVVQGGFRYTEDNDLMRQFEADFPYVETDDQRRAIDEIKKDMTSDKPMDRLICGDVGYGKTEVAMRAAFKAVVNGNKQVAVLVPTTVLAMQHFETFVERMRGFPIEIQVLSRFQTAKESKEILAKVKQGKVDILVGTHRLLSQDLQFKDLGLLIIDEEQKFGVRAKEHLKKMKANVDALTLSATPIPRTLYMSLIQIREMSLINTPPQDRLPIKTIIAETDFEIIQNALLRELTRGGQAFFIHNRVETIYERAAQIGKLAEQARTAIVHGQMEPEEIDAIFHSFKKGEIDLLFATTIVENGIDIPNANTILIDRADTYGLADLYQLRGRVGRWNRSAYAYFLIPKNSRLSEVSQKRLQALAESSGYGGGMKVAMRDLEIRGAGDILGVQQSGQVSAIGFHLYCRLLKRAIDALKQKKPISFAETKMEFSFPAYLPESYINEVSLRMELYYRLGEATALLDADAILNELKDRFGEPPEPVLWLYHLARIRIFASLRNFSLLQFKDLSFTAEKQVGGQTHSATFLLPKKIQNPKTLEEFVIERLSL